MVLILALVLAVIFLPWPLNIAVIFAAAVFEGGMVCVGIRYARRRRAGVGIEALIGQEAEVISWLEPVGQVKSNGEIWQGHASRTFEAGDVVRVIAVHGLTVEVEPCATRASTT